MPDDRTLVINTGPVLALIAALGDLALLDELYERVVVPRNVADEISVGGHSGFGVEVFHRSRFLDVQSRHCQISSFLQRALDPGEASVIQTAEDFSIPRVCIDEAAGRRVARLYGLSVTGSLGILIKGIRVGKKIDLNLCIKNMRLQGIWIGERTVRKALEVVSHS